MEAVDPNVLSEEHVKTFLLFYLSEYSREARNGVKLLLPWGLCHLPFWPAAKTLLSVNAIGAMFTPPLRLLIKAVKRVRLEFINTNPLPSLAESQTRCVPERESERGVATLASVGMREAPWFSRSASVIMQPQTDTTAFNLGSRAKPESNPNQFKTEENQQHIWNCGTRCLPPSSKLGWTIDSSPPSPLPFCLSWLMC